jgi:hypothetical protein
VLQVQLVVDMCVNLSVRPQTSEETRDFQDMFAFKNDEAIGAVAYQLICVDARTVSKEDAVHIEEGDARWSVLLSRLAPSKTFLPPHIWSAVPIRKETIDGDSSTEVSRNIHLPDTVTRISIAYANFSVATRIDINKKAILLFVGQRPEISPKWPPPQTISTTYSTISHIFAVVQAA